MMQMIGYPIAVSSLSTTSCLALLSSNGFFSWERFKCLNSIGPNVNGLGVLCRNAFLKSLRSVKSSSSSSCRSGSPVAIGVTGSSSAASSPFFALPLLLADFFLLASLAASSAFFLACSSLAVTAAFASVSLASNYSI